MENISTVEFRVKEDAYYHALENLNNKVSKNDIFVSYNEYLINTLTKLLISFNDNKLLNLEDLANQFLMIKIDDISKK